MISFNDQELFFLLFSLFSVALLDTTIVLKLLPKYPDEAEDEFAVASSNIMFVPIACFHDASYSLPRKTTQGVSVSKFFRG